MTPAGAPEDALRRSHRAAVAERLLASAPELAPCLDWDTLDRAPAWLSLPADALAALARRLGALLAAPAMALWIDRARLAAAREAVGGPCLRAALAHDGAAPLRTALALQVQVVAADQVGALLQSWGAAVLLATLPPGALERAAAAALAPAAMLGLEAPLARALVEREAALGAS